MIRSIAFTILLSFGLTSIAYAGNGEIRKRSGAIRDRYIVVLEDTVDKHQARGAASALANEHGAAVRTVWTSALKGFVVTMPEGRARAMSRDPRVRFIEEDAEIFTSAAVPTNFDPSQECDPAVETCPTTPENRLWHLDRLEQNSAALNNRFAYCSTGVGVYIYVVDTGVMAQHSEFWASETDPSHPRVLSGYSAAARVPINPNDPDNAPADDPANGWGSTPSEIYNCGHGTSVASVAAGRKVGFAKGATIVPVKVTECNPFRGSVGQLIEGVDWIVRVRGEEADPNDGNPEAYRDTEGKVRLLHPSVATFSTFRRVTSEDPEEISAFELTLDALHDANVTVTASANNQNEDACLTTPGRHSRGNPNPALRGKVITAGGTQILNSPMGLPVSSGTYDPSEPASDGRWICDPAVDDTPCSNNPGSNFGACVTIFAPARNITSASMAGERAYRTGMGGGLPNGEKTLASGTSFSAPIVAAAAARFLEQFPPQSRHPDAVYDQLTLPGRNNLQGQLDQATLGAGSPNLMLRFGDVKVTMQPVSTGVENDGSATLSVTASTSIPPLHYQWLRITNPSYVPDGAPALGWPVVTPIGTDSPSLIVSPSTRTSYQVRVTNDCCEADSNAATVFPRPGIPQNVSATPSWDGTSVTVAWTPADNEAEMFDVEEQITAAAGFASLGSTEGNTWVRFVPPDSARVYRVRASAGVSTIRPASSDFSNRDLAVTVPFSDAPIDSTVYVKATHVTELRKTVNALCDHLGFARIYSPAETLFTSLQSATVEATQWSSLQTQINDRRTNPAIGVPAFPFPEVPQPDVLIRKSHIDALRDSVK
ncbi:MAG TPA: S8 family serine peptidase [Thermoanaerobaculia bacterium]|nr:S8 family serine peptidase [Thermoanaerobaculia bacterium]